MPRTLAVLAVCLGVATAPPAHASLDPDSLYFARHPTLLFGWGELPALRARVATPGAAADAYAFIRSTFANQYLAIPLDSLLANDFAQEPIINVGLIGHVDLSVDAMTLGRDLTLHITRNWGVNTDAYGTALRLRALAIGYDLSLGVASPAERAEVRSEVASYLAYITTNMNYDVWRHSPYVSNKTAMVAAALGLAAISFAGEIDPALTAAALQRADVLYQAWRQAHVADDGCYREGALYACWSLRQLVYYFEARERHDGSDYASDWSLREIERWLAYELDPRGDARLNNLNDLTDYFRPLARHTTYLEWAMSEWGSGLARYIWDRAAGPFGVDMGDENDKAATVLWHADVAPVNPGAVLPESALWESRGLYYYRSGWAEGASCDDVVVSFYSGEFRGGHAQEDQNQFTLTAFGERLVMDHGAGDAARQSEAHNIVRISGAGQHNAGKSIGTDGRIAGYLFSDFADYVCGDATAAYTTYSPYNAPGVPYPWSDWSWGYSGANPVERALRRVIVVHDDALPPYVIVQDDIQKDGLVRGYDWCMHVPAAAAVDASNPGGPIAVAVGGAHMDAHVLFPARASLAGVSVTPFDNESEDPDSKLVKLGAYAVNPKFALLLSPRRAADPAPGVFSSTFAFGSVSVVTPPPGTHDLTLLVFARGNAAGPVAPPPLPALPEASGCGSVVVDAELAVVGLEGQAVTRYLAVEAKSIACASADVVTILDGTATVAFDGTRVHIDRPDAEFRILADGVSEVWYRGEVVPTGLDGRYLVRVSATAVGSTPPPGGLALRAFPNPFHPSTRVSLSTPSRGWVRADVYDAAGRFVVRLAAGSLPAGTHTLAWNGRDGGGREVPSGVYFLRVRASSETATLKLVLLR